MAPGRKLYSNAQKRRTIRKIEKAAKLVSRRDLRYAYGGGRGATRMTEPPLSGPWTDCSGFFMWLCQKAGVHLKNYVGSTRSLAEEGMAGTSPWFTAFIKNNPGGDEHIIIRLRRKWLASRLLFGEFRWVECGGSDNPSLLEGPTFFHPTPERIAEFPIRRYFKEL